LERGAARQDRPRHPPRLLDRELGADRGQGVAVPPYSPPDDRVPQNLPRRPAALTRLRRGAADAREPAGPTLRGRLSGGLGPRRRPRPRPRHADEGVPPERLEAANRALR